MAKNKKKKKINEQYGNGIAPIAASIGNQIAKNILNAENNIPTQQPETQANTTYYKKYGKLYKQELINSNVNGQKDSYTYKNTQIKKQKDIDNITNDQNIKIEDKSLTKEEAKNRWDTASKKLEDYKKQKGINLFNESKFSKDKTYQSLLKNAQQTQKEWNLATDYYGGLQLDQDLQENKNIAGTIIKGGTALASGFTRGVGGLESTARKVTGQINEDEREKYEIFDPMAEAAYKNASKPEQIAMGILQSWGQMMPQMAVGNNAAAMTVGFANYGGSAYNDAKKEGYNEKQATMFGIASGATEMFMEKLLGGFENIYGKSALGSSANTFTNRVISKLIKNEAVRKTLSGMKGEFTEEYLQEFLEPILKNIILEEDNGADFWNTMKDDWKSGIKQLASQLFNQQNLEAGFQGALSSGLLQAPQNFQLQQEANKYGMTMDQYTNAVNGTVELTDNVKKVIDNVLKERIQEEYDGKATKKEKEQIRNEIIEDIKNGYISTDEIEKTLGGETYTKLEEINKQKSDIQTQIDELQQKADKNELSSLEEKQKLNDLKEQIKTIDDSEIRNQLNQEIQETIKNDIGLQESYREIGRRTENYKVDLDSIQDEKQRAVYQKAMDSGVLNNSNKTHALVDMIAKISSEKGINFDFTNNEQLEKSGFGVNGRNINGYVTDSGITINLNSQKAINRIVGHELTHTFEGTTLYTELQDSLKDFLGSEWDNQLERYKELYKGVKNANIENELTSDLIGDYLFTDENYVKNLSTKNKNLFEKVYDEIKYLYNVATAGSKEKRQLEKVKRTFDRIYNETESKVTTEDAKLSIEENTKSIQGLEDYTREEIKNITNDYIKQVLEDNGYDDIEIIDSDIHGSRNRGTAKADSDLDVVVQYNGDIREDDFFNMLNDNGDDNLYINGIKVDINPIKENLSDYMERSNEYDKEVLNKNAKYSISEDSQGRKLNENQKEYFKNSKVVDNNGNLKVLYNGSGNHTEYLPGFMSDESIWGKGIYLTPYKDIAENYGSDVKETYVNIEKPIGSGKNLTFEQYNEFYKAINDGEEAYREEYDMYDNDFDLLWDATNKGSWADYADELKEYTGYDGIIVDNPDAEESDQMVIAFKSNQIKNVSNENPTSNADIRYDLTVKEANTTQDNKGRKLSKDQLSYFKDTKAVDNDGNLITVYHTTTNDVAQFNEFNPVGTPYYKFGDQVVNYYTNSKTMSGSYADYEYQMADTSKITDKKGVNDILVETNNKLNGDRLFVIETNANGTYFLYDKLHKNNHLMTKLYKSQEELFKNIKQDLQERAGFREKTQYEGYVNITNPYVIDAEGANWDEILTDYDSISVRYANEISQEQKEKLIDLAEESKRRNDAIYDELRELYSESSDIKMIGARPEYKKQMIKEAKKKGISLSEQLEQRQAEIDKKLEEIKSKQYFEDDYFRNSQEVKEILDELNYGFNMNFTEGDLYKMASSNFDEDSIKNIFGIRSTTNEIVKKALSENKYDGVIIKNVLDYGSTIEFDDNGAAQDVYVTFNSNQFKAVDNTNPTDDPDIRYSLSTDSNGRELSEGQQEYFKDSKVRDENGNLLVLHHGTDADFNIFEHEYISEDNKDGLGFYFTPNELKFNYDNPKTVYVNITNPATNQELIYKILKRENELFKTKSNKKEILNQIQKEFGVDGIIDSERNNIVAFNSNQIKNIDNLNPTANDDIRYSLSQDSQGRELSEGQQEYFKDSKVRDENGNLIPMYHGTPNGEFTIFHPGSYFSPNKEYASGYEWEGASSISSGKGTTTPKTYEVYLNITNPFTIQDAKAKDIYINEYIKGGNSMYYDPYTDYTNTINNMDEIDWTEGEDLREWLKENHPEYDGLVLDEGGDGGYGMAEYRWRGKSYMPFESNQVKNIDNLNPTENDDIRYSLDINQKLSDLDNEIIRDNRGEYKGFYNWAKSIIKNNNELQNELLFKHHSQNFEIPINDNETRFYHGTDATYDYNSLKTMDFDEQTMDRNYGDYFYITPDKSFANIYGKQIAEFIVPNDRILSFDEYRNEINNGKTEDELFNKYWAIEMPDNEYIVKDTKPLIDYSKQKAQEYIDKREQENTRYSLDIAPISKNLLTQAEQDELDGLRAVENSGFAELTPEEQSRMMELENRANKVLDKKAEKMLRSASYKAINTSTKIAENYLDFDARQKKEFRNQMREFSNMTRDELVNAETYNKVKDIVNQYANKEYTYFDDSIESVKKELKHTKIQISDELKNQITDYGDFVRDSRLLLRRNSGESVDKVYKEYSEMYPGFFDENVWNEADQLEALNDFVNHDFSVTEKYRLSDSDLKAATDLIYNKLLDNSLTQQDLIETEEILDKKVQKRTRSVVREELLNKMGITPETIQAGNDISAISFARTDPIRVNEKVFGWETGQKINDATVNFTKHQEAERMRFLNKERQEIKDLGIKARSKESELVQKYGEKQYIDKNNEVHEYGDAELERDVKDYATREKIKNAARVLRQKYDTYIDRLNSVMTEMGYDEIPKRKDYMIHFVELEDKFSRWGLPFNKESMSAEDLPTDINGLTEFNRPGRSYFASAKARTGLQTTYDAITGIDKYLEGMSNWIYHTESIQRYRALSRFIRENYGREHGFDNIDLMTDEELADRIKDIQDNKLSKYVAWLDEQANSIAGKKGALDRSVERMFGRRIYTALNTLKSQVGSNMTGFNVRSAMTNFASAIQGASKTQKLAFVKGTVSTLNNIIHNDGMIDKSDFLTRRFGSESLALKPWQKLSQAGQVFMSGTDYFTSNQIWRSKYFENLQKGMSEQQAIKNADDFAARIMGDRSKGSTAELFNSKTLGFLSQFQLEVNNQWSSLVHDYKMDIQKGNKNALGVTFELGQLFAASYMFNTMMKSLTGSDVMIDPIDMLLKIFKPDDRDKDKSIVERAQKVLGEFINQLPFANLVTGGGRIPISEAFTGVSTLGKKLMGGTDNYGNEITWGDVKDDALESAAYWLLPTGYGQIRKTTKGLSMYDDKLPIAGSYTDSGNLRFSAEDTPFGRVKAGLFGQYSSKYAQDYIESGYKSINASKLDEMKDLDMNSTEYRNYREGLSAAGTSVEDKLDYINSLDVPYADKDIMASNVAKKDIDMKEYNKYGSYEEFNYVQKNPAKYQVMKYVGGYDAYKNYEKAINDIKADYDRNGKAITNSRKNKVIKYVNSLNLTKAQKAMLIKEQYPSFTKYDKEIASYINSQNIRYIEKASILKQLGFTAYDRQIINYIKQNYRTVEEQQEELEKLGFKVYNYNGKTYVR